MSLALRDGRLELTEAGGQYILKPIPHGEFRHLDAVPVNEHLTMQIARQVFGIRVAENALVELKGSEFEGSEFDGRWRAGLSGSPLRRRGRRLAAFARGFRSNRAEPVREELAREKLQFYDFSYEEIGGLMREHVAACRVELEKFFRLVVFNYLIHNGDAHLKNFSLIRNEEYGDYTLTPAYDLLNTRLHVADETRTALPLFKDDFQTESHRLNNAFYAYDDFQALANRLGLHPARFQRFMRTAVSKEREVFSLIDRSALSEKCKQVYKESVRDSMRALAYSHAESARGTGGPDIFMKRSPRNDSGLGRMAEDNRAKMLGSS